MIQREQEIIARLIRQETLRREAIEKELRSVRQQRQIFLTIIILPATYLLIRMILG